MAYVVLGCSFAIALIWATVSHVLDERLYRARCWREAMATMRIAAGPYRSTHVTYPLERAPLLVRFTALVLYFFGIPAYLVLGSVAIVVSFRSLLASGQFVELRELPTLTYGLGSKLLARDPSAPTTIARLVTYSGYLAATCAGLAIFASWHGAFGFYLFGAPCVLLAAFGCLLSVTRRRHAHLFVERASDPRLPSPPSEASRT